MPTNSHHSILGSSYRLLVLPLLTLVNPTFLSATVRHPEPAATRAEFESVCQRLEESDNHYFGKAIVTDLRARLVSPVDDARVRILLRGRLGFELIRLGDLEGAIEVLERGLSDLERAPQDVASDEHLRAALVTRLAAAHLQVAEDENCIELHAATSCILPIDRDAVHRRPEHARRAGELYEQHLRRQPGDLQARWLLNLARMITGEYPDRVPKSFQLPTEALTSEVPFPRWFDVAPTLGINAFDLAGGAIMDDFDGDGLLDLVSSSWDPCEPMKAFRNDGQGGFENVSESWGLDSQLGGLNLMPGDFDNDGRLDVLVLRGAWLGKDGRIRNSLLRNDLHRAASRFVDVTAAAGVADPPYPTQAAGWGDFDGDGDLDLFIGNEASAVAVDPLQLAGRTGESYPSQLFRNNGDGTFLDITQSAGVGNHRYAKAVAWGDYDNDGDPDLYVSNIGPNRLYRNNGDTTFTDVAASLGVVEPVRGSFPAWFFDYDNDGDLDIFVAAYWSPVDNVSASYFGLPSLGGHPRLYRNDGGSFADVSRELGFDRPLLPMGANYGDLDNDGFPDIYLGTGVPNYDALMPNVMYRNDRGRRFVDITFAGGFGHLQKGHGIAFGDLDNDGDQDLFEQLGGAYPYDGYGNALWENPGNDRKWLVLRLIGRQANRFGVGARIEVVLREGDRSRSVHQLVGSGGSFGASSLQQEIGLGEADRIESLVIRWPGSGTRQEFSDVPDSRFFEVIEGEDELTPLEPPLIRLAGRVTSASGEHHHHDNKP